MLFISGCVLTASLWNLDWCLWTGGFWLYYPGIIWHVKANNTPQGLGFWVNVQYFQIVIAFLLAIVAAYLLGEGR